MTRRRMATILGWSFERAHRTLTDADALVVRAGVQVTTLEILNDKLPELAEVLRPYFE